MSGKRQIKFEQDKENPLSYELNIPYGCIYFIEGRPILVRHMKQGMKILERGVVNSSITKIEAEIIKDAMREYGMLENFQEISKRLEESKVLKCLIGKWDFKSCGSGDLVTHGYILRNKSKYSFYRILSLENLFNDLAMHTQYRTITVKTAILIFQIAVEKGLPLTDAEAWERIEKLPEAEKPLWTKEK